MGMHSPRGHFVWVINHYVRFIFAFFRRALQKRVILTGDAKRNRRSKVRLRVVCFVGVVSLPLFVSLVRNYQWERRRPQLQSFPI